PLRRQAGGVEPPGTTGKRDDVFLPVPGSSAPVDAFYPQRPVDHVLADLLDRDRRGDPAGDLGLVDPAPGGELDRGVGLAPLILIRVGEEHVVVAGEVEV